MQQLEGIEALQHHLLVPASGAEQQRRERLMAMIDGLNRCYGRSTVQWPPAAFTPPGACVASG